MIELTQSTLKEIISYDCNTGVISWKERDVKWFKNRAAFIMWNKRYANNVCGNIKSVPSGNSYRHVSVFKRPYLAHRLVWLYVNGEFPLNEIDHINGDGLDNRIENLRDVPRSENNKNKRFRPDISLPLGIHKRGNSWRACIGVDGRLKWLGSFETIELAIQERRAAEIKYNYHENHGSKAAYQRLQFRQD